MTNNQKEIDPSSFIKGFFEIPEDDWRAMPFKKIKAKFMQLWQSKDIDNVLIEIAKAYASDSAKTYYKEQVEGQPLESPESLFKIADIAAVGFMLMGVYYGYLLKQKELREKPLVMDWTVFDKKTEEKEDLC